MNVLESVNQYKDRISAELNNTLTETNLGSLPKRKGKVRDQYDLGDNLALITTDRQSAFDRVLAAIPFKGQVLNQIAEKFLDATADIVPNWKIATPDPMVTVGHKCDPFKVEMVIRGYLTGHAARTYQSGLRVLCGVDLPEGLKENQKFEKPIIPFIGVLIS